MEQQRAEVSSDEQLQRALSLGIRKLSEALPKPYNVMAKPLLRQAENQLQSISPGELRPRLTELRDLLNAALTGNLDSFVASLENV